MNKMLFLFILAFSLPITAQEIPDSVKAQIKKEIQSKLPPGVELRKSADTVEQNHLEKKEKVNKAEPKLDKDGRLVESVRCKGTTQKGHQCKRRTKDPSGYCWQHKK
jgi:hypothetical protein